jgi:hypothetical protein
MIMKLIKKIIFQIIIYNTVLIINKCILVYIDVHYINTLWGMICFWVLSDSLIVNMDMKNLENNYNELKDRHNLISSDFILNLKDKYNQINLICKILAEYIIINTDIKNEILLIKSLLSPLGTPNKQNTPVIKPFNIEAIKLEPSTEQLTEQLTEPLIEPLLEPLIEPLLEPLIEPLLEPLTEPLLEPLTEPLLEPLIEPLIEPNKDLAIKLKNKLTLPAYSKSCIF